MKRYIQHGFLTISHFVSREWQHPVHNHNHFELIFIHRGKGAHCLSGMCYAYEGSSLFLLAPCDYHLFKIEEETEFTFLKFTNVYMQGVGNPAYRQAGVQLQHQWNQGMDEILIQMRQQNKPLLQSVQDAAKMDAVVRLIVQEWEGSKTEANEAIFFLIQALLGMVRRNLQATLPQGPAKHAGKVTQLLNYLHSHIHSFEHTQLVHLAAQFNYSKNYLGAFFKEQTGMTLRDYVNQYKLHIMENKLQHSSLSIKEISHEMGFTDLSHFNKFFKSHKGMSPSAFRALVGTT
jgi:AraC-like DNA-binding protein